MKKYLRCDNCGKLFEAEVPAGAAEPDMVLCPECLADEADGKLEEEIEM
jgi:hypothetical protein